jgi:superfamily I DNA/RNA helicase
MMLQFFEKELKQVKPNRIAFLTFTRAARLEALGRASLSELELPFVKTIHAICYRQLGVSQSQMVQTKHLKSFGKRLGVEISGYNPDTFSLDALTMPQVSKGDKLLQMNHLGRHRMVHLKTMMKDAPQDIDWHFAKWFTESYRAWKKAEGIYDYTDLLTEYLRIGGPLPIDVIFIDEGQDLSKLQWEVVHHLGRFAKRRYIAGDDDQAIFTWAGASAELFNNEPSDENKVLPQSFRVPKAVHQLAGKIINRVRDRYPKDFNSREEVGEYRPVGQLSYDLLGAPSTYILYRNHHRGKTLATLLEDLGWPFEGTFSVLGNDRVKAALRGWGRSREGQPIPATEARAIVEFAQTEALKPNAIRITNNTRGELPAAEFIQDPHGELSRLLSRLPKLDYLCHLERTVGLREMLQPSVTLMSIHQSKGREADTVILDLEMATKTYDGYLKDPDSEHRVFYVGVTRAKQRLFSLLPTEAMAYQL